MKAPPPTPTTTGRISFPYVVDPSNPSPSITILFHRPTAGYMNVPGAFPSTH